MKSLTSVAPWYSPIGEALAGRPVISAVLVTALTVATRLMIDLAIPHVVPYVLVFMAVTVATLLAGTRSGLLTILLCQSLIWFYVVPPAEDIASERAQIVGLALTTLSQLFIVSSLGAYREIAMERLRHEQLERQHAELALRELDHRTKNSFQLATGLLRTRAQQMKAPELREELDRAAQRLISLESAHSNDAVAHGTAQSIALLDYIDYMVQRLGDGIDGMDVGFVTDVQPLMVPRHMAISIGLILNEAIFNSVKHAFGPDGGTITIRASHAAETLIVEISDDGRGFPASANSQGNGIGSKMIDAIARSIQAKITRLPGPGAGYCISLPLQQAPSGPAAAEPTEPTRCIGRRRIAWHAKRVAGRYARAGQ